MTWVLWLSIGLLVAFVFVRVMLGDTAYRETSAHLNRQLPMLGRAVFGFAALWAVILWPLAIGVVIVMLLRARKNRSA